MTDKPKARIRRSRREKHATNEDCLKLMRAALAQPDRELAERDYCFLAVDINTGLRVLELVQLRFEDFDATSRKMLVPTAKQRCAVVDEQDVADGGIWTVAEWAKFCGRKEGYLFPGSKPDTHLTTRAASGIYYKHADACGLDIASKREGQKGRGIHSLRHHFTTRLLEKGTPLQAVILLRQRSTDAVSHYTESQREREYVEKASVIHGSGLVRPVLG